jgi:hypothetical protein
MISVSLNRFSKKGFTPSRAPVKDDGPPMFIITTPVGDVLKPRESISDTSQLKDRCLAAAEDSIINYFRLKAANECTEEF